MTTHQTSTSFQQTSRRRHGALRAAAALAAAVLLGACAAGTEDSEPVEPVGGAEQPLCDSCGYTGNSHDTLANDFHSIGLTLCSTHFPSGSDEYQAVQAALTELNSVQDSDLYFYIAGTAAHRTYSDALASDGVNRLDMPTCTVADCSYDGRTVMHKNFWGNIDEFDIVFDPGESWAFGEPASWALSDGYVYFRTVLLHELGHGIGFEHSAGTTEDLSIMGSKTGKWVGNKKIGLKAYDHGHIRYHYDDGAINGEPDLVLSNYRTELNSSGNYECVLNEGLSDTTVYPGQTIELTWTRFNTGSDDVTATYDTTVYLSTNTTISTADRAIKAWYHTGTVSDSSTLYASTNITIPSDVTPGTYYVGLIIDVNGDIDEASESNNSLVIHEALTVY